MPAAQAPALVRLAQPRVAPVVVPQCASPPRQQSGLAKGLRLLGSGRNAAATD